MVTSRRAERLDKLRLSFGNPQKRLLTLPGDISNFDHRDALIRFVEQEYGGLDILINNAGIGAIGSFEDAAPERLRKIFDVDFFAAAELTRLAIPHLKLGNEAAICNVSSVLGHRAVPNKSEYCAAKFALRGWAESLRVELKRHKVDVINISPSTTRSEFFDSLVDTVAGTQSQSLGSQSAEKVAGQIVKALRKRKRDMVLSAGGKALVWLSRFSPGLTDRLLAAAT